MARSQLECGNDLQWAPPSGVVGDVTAQAVRVTRRNEAILVGNQPPP
jgi:hypothetical protein